MPSSRSLIGTDTYPLPNGLPIPHVIADREEDLHRRWEAMTNRTLPGNSGRYVVRHPGKRNGGAGPDYLGAVITFPSGKEFCGDVEIHLTRSGWRQHGHEHDLRYSQVILHVVASGSSDSVGHNELNPIPTVYLPWESPNRITACANGEVLEMRPEESDAFIETMARIRWNRRVAKFSGRNVDATLALLAGRLGADAYTVGLQSVWRILLPEVNTLLTFLSMLEEIVDGSPIKLGPNIRSRTLLLSAIAHSWFHDQNGVYTWDLNYLRQLTKGLGQVGLESASGGFLTEIVGNWLFPLICNRTGEDKFDAWRQLPRGWYYGRVKRLVEDHKLSRPGCFGEQQGLLEWLETLCQPRDCANCPVTGFAGDR